MSMQAVFLLHNAAAFCGTDVVAGNLVRTFGITAGTVMAMAAGNLRYSSPIAAAFIMVMTAGRTGLGLGITAGTVMGMDITLSVLTAAIVNIATGLTGSGLCITAVPMGMGTGSSRISGSIAALVIMAVSAVRAGHSCYITAVSMHMGTLRHLGITAFVMLVGAGHSFHCFPVSAAVMHRMVVTQPGILHSKAHHRTAVHQ